MVGRLDLNKSVVPEYDPLVFPYTQTRHDPKAQGPLHDSTPLYEDPPRTMRMLPDHRGFAKSVQLGHTYRSHETDHAAPPIVGDPGLLHDRSLPGLPRRITGVHRGTGHVEGSTVDIYRRTGGTTVGSVGPVVRARLTGRGQTAGVHRGDIDARSRQLHSKNEGLFVNTAGDRRFGV